MGLRRSVWISILCLQPCLLLANRDSTEVREKSTQLLTETIAYFDSMCVARNLELNQLFFAEEPTSLSLDTAFEISDSLLIDRLNTLNNHTPLTLSYNKRIRSFIALYAKRKPELTERILGLSQYYYPIIEEALDKYDIPLEIKHLAVVESALNPSARSRAGATGMWQFMYWTGKANGLNVNSYIDERRDPFKATEAACKYLLSLHGIYNDWNLALAAYNSGPGNVNKAIRRSGGKTDYWSIWPYLPRETRSYVPAFIAVNYIMNYASEHGLKAKAPSITFWESDTLRVRGPLNFSQLSKQLNIEETLLLALNPSYKRALIPSDGKSHVLVLPANKVYRFLELKDTLYAANSQQQVNLLAEEEQATFHYVRSGEVLGLIAQKHRCSVRQLMEWNNLRSTRIRVGQKLVVYKKVITSSPTLSQQKKSTHQVVEQKENKEVPGKTAINYTYHIVRPGDTLWDIARLYKGASVTELKQLNGELNVRRLKPGQKIKIKVAG